jgi:multiple sugar transport system substrate-binding protein
MKIHQNRSGEMSRAEKSSCLRPSKGLLVLALALLALSWGCARKAEPIRLALFLGDPLIQIIQQACTDIEKKNPGLKVRVEYISFGRFQEKITAQLAAGNPPDVMMLECNNFVDLYLRDALEDLTPYAQRDGLDLSNHFPGIVNRLSPGGRLFAIPQDTAPAGLVYYNRKIFREAGIPYPKNNWTWPEPFLSLCKKLMKYDEKGKVTRWAYSEAWTAKYDNFLFTSGGNFVDDVNNPTRLTLDTPEAVRGIQFLWDLIYQYKVSPSPTSVQTFSINGSIENMFIDGTLAMLDTGTWVTPKFLQAKNLDFDFVEFPAGPTGIKGWGTGGSGFAIAKACKNKEMAWIVAKAITGDEVVSKLAQTGWLVPANRKLAKSDVYLKSPGAPSKALVLDMPKYAIYEPFMKGWGEILYGNVGPALDRAWLGDEKPRDVLPKLVPKLNKKFFGKK